MRKLASPRKIKVTPYLTVTRIYADVTCVDCGFKGAPHRRNFAVADVKNPVCQDCMVIRRAKRYAEEDLQAKVYFEERRRRKKLKAKQRTPKNNALNVNRWRAKQRIMRRLARGE